MRPILPPKRHLLKALASRARRWLNDNHTNVRSVRRVRRIIDNFNSSAQGALHFETVGAGTSIGLTPPPLTSKTGNGYVYVILHQDIEHGVYVGWTTQPLQERFWEHWNGLHVNHSTRSRTICAEMYKHGIHKFVILAVEQVAFTAPCAVVAGTVALHRRREQFWQSRFNSRVADGGYNDIRVIRIKSRQPHNGVHGRIFGQREYSLKAEHLLQHWKNGGEQLTADHFAAYGDSKLLHFVEIWSMSAPATPSHRLCRLLLSVLADRARAASEITPQAQQVRSVVFPFSSYLWDQFPLAKLLADEKRRELLPPSSGLREHVFAVRLKYTRPLKLHACNYSDVPRPVPLDSIHSETDSSEPVCICNQSPFANFMNSHHKHVLTADMKVVQHLPDLYSMLCKGTSFRSEFLDEGATAQSVLSFFLDSIISEFSSYDGLPKAAYLAWKASITSALTPAVISKFERSLPQSFADECAETRSSLRRAMGMLKSISKHFVITTTDKATGSFAVICKLWYSQHLAAALRSSTYVADGANADLTVTEMYQQIERFHIPADSVVKFDERGRRSQASPDALPFCFLTLKAHKSPVSVRMVTSVALTPLSSFARVTAKLLGACIDVFNDIWVTVARLTGISCSSSWITSNSAQVPPRIRRAMAFADNWLRPMEVYDFTQMYTQFVPYDMKQQIAACIDDIFIFQSGASIFTADGDFGHRGGVRKPGDVKLTLLLTYAGRSRGMQLVDSVTWSNLDVDAAMPHGEQLFDAAMLKDMVSIVLDNAYVTHKGLVYRQVTGMPMGINCAPQFANLYCGYYELCYMVRTSMAYLTSQQRCRTFKAFLNAMFNGSRFIDDIGLIGIPAAFCMTELFQDKRASGGADGIYPMSIKNSDGADVMNPMELKLENSGLSCHYLDLQLTIGERGSFQSTVYQKRDDMPVFHDYRRFPHIDSMISNRAKYGVFTSQLHRFASLCSSTQTFSYNVLRLLAEMLHHGYDYRTLRRRLSRFKHSYRTVRQRVFAHDLSSSSVQHKWRQLLFQCDNLRRQIQQTSHTQHSAALDHHAALTTTVI